MAVVDDSPPRAACTTRIERVVVHRNGALVTRRGRLTARGRAEVELLGLPLTFTAETLRVRGVGCRVGFVDEIARAELVRAPAAMDEAALVEHRLRVAAVDARRALVQRLLQLAGSMRIELPPADVDALPVLDAVAGLGRTKDAQRRALLAELRALDDERTALARETERFERPTAAPATPPRLLRGVRALVDAANDDAALEVEYFVAAARWVPSYTLHLKTADGSPVARLVLGALVAQATGEDWDDVELAVSTADLRRDTTLPPLHSWRLGRAQPSTLKGFRPLPSDLPSLFSGWDRFPVVTPPLPPSPARPAPSAAPRDVVDEVLDDKLDDEFDDLSEGAYAQAAPEADDDIDEEADARFVPAPAAAPVPSFAPPSAPLGGAPTPKKAEFARSRAAVGGGGFGGARDELAAAPAVVDELPPRLRTAALRMAGADEHERGLLLALSGREHLAWLLDPVDVAGGGEAGIHDDVVVQMNRALDGLMRAGRRMLERGPPPGTRLPAGAARVFVASGRASVPGDGDEHRVEVHSETSAASIVHVAVPRASLDVHRACRFVVAGPLPAGPVQVYDDGAFVVASELAVTGGGTPVQLQLGVDPDVRVQARTPHVQQSEKGLVGGTSVVEHRVVVEARSSRASSVTLSLYDRVPVVEEGQRDLAVGAPWVRKNGAASTFASTGRGPRDESLAGGVRIDVALQPGVPVVVEHGYALTLPAKLEVVGGNRRE